MLRFQSFFRRFIYDPILEIPGLVSYYLGKAQSRFSWIISGRQLNDEIGNFHGQLKTGIALECKSTNSDWVSFPAVNLNDFLISFWVDLDQKADTRFNALGSSTSSQHFILENSNNDIRFRNGGGAVSIASLTGITGFKNIVITRAGSQITTFVNGSQINTLSVNNSPLNVSTIGNVNGGFLDTVGNCWEIYSAPDAFTPSEIYNNPQGFFERSKTSLRSYAFCENNFTQGTPIHDYSPNNAHGYFNTSFATPASYNAAIYGIGEGLQLGLVNYNQYAFLYGDGNYYEFTEDLSGATNANIEIEISGFTGTHIVVLSDGAQFYFAAQNNASIDTFYSLNIGGQLYIDDVEYVSDVNSRQDLWNAINDGGIHVLRFENVDLSTLTTLYLNKFNTSLWNANILYLKFRLDLDGDEVYEHEFNGTGKAFGNYSDLTLTEGKLLNIAGQDQNGLDILGNALPVHIDGILSNVNNEGQADLQNNLFHSTGESTIAFAIKADSSLTGTTEAIITNRISGEGFLLYRNALDELRFLIENTDATFQEYLVESDISNYGWMAVVACQAASNELNIYIKTKTSALLKIGNGSVFKSWISGQTNLILFSRSNSSWPFNGKTFKLPLFNRDISQNNGNLGEVHLVANSLLNELPE